MSLTKGDHVVIKRDGFILTPDCAEAYHEFEVVEHPVSIGVEVEDTTSDDGISTIVPGYEVLLRVIQ